MENISHTHIYTQYTSTQTQWMVSCWKIQHSIRRLAGMCAISVTVDYLHKVHVVDCFLTSGTKVYLLVNVLCQIWDLIKIYALEIWCCWWSVGISRTALRQYNKTAEWNRCPYGRLVPLLFTMFPTNAKSVNTEVIYFEKDKFIINIIAGLT